MSAGLFGTNKRESDGDHWLSVGDLMAGLMMIFLFIAIVYMRMVVIERDKIKAVVVAWEDIQESLYEELYTEFKDDLDDWNAEIKKETLTVRFKEPEVLFNQGKTELQERFKVILEDFFPRYVDVLDDYSNHESEGAQKTRGRIEEVRIEGHTSSEWNSAVDEDIAYYLNMKLSQGRTRSVLRYSMNTIDTNEYEWLSSVIAAVGFSSSRPIKNEKGMEDKKRSRRVDFRVKTTVERELMKVIRD